MISMVTIMVHITMVVMQMGHLVNNLVNILVHQQISPCMIAIANMSNMSHATTTSGIVHIVQNILTKSVAGMFHNLIKNNVADMYHNTTAKHAIVKYHNTIIPANVHKCLNILVKDAANMCQSTITNMFVSQHAHQIVV